jgi:hypothetical protein
VGKLISVVNGIGRLPRETLSIEKPLNTEEIIPTPNSARQEGKKNLHVDFTARKLQRHDP